VRLGEQSELPQKLFTKNPPCAASLSILGVTPCCLQNSDKRAP
jgi:hypothetical protein